MVLWLTFLNINQLIGSYLSEEIALAFLTTLMEKDFSWSHINTIWSGVSFFLKLEGAQSLFSFFSIKQAMKGYKNKTITVDRRQPITPTLLKKCCGTTERICYNTYEAILFKAEFFLCFFAELRISELVQPNKKGLSVILFKAVKVNDRSVKIFL